MITQKEVFQIDEIGLHTDKTDNRNEDMFVWCYESISLHAGDL